MLTGLPRGHRRELVMTVPRRVPVHDTRDDLGTRICLRPVTIEVERLQP